VVELAAAHHRRHRQCGHRAAELGTLTLVTEAGTALVRGWRSLWCDSNTLSSMGFIFIVVFYVSHRSL